MKRKSIFNRIANLIIILSIISMLGNCTSKTTSPENEIKQIVEITNKKCPLPIDNETRLDKLSLPEKNTIQYHYTLLNVDINSVDIQPLMGRIKQRLIDGVKTNPELKYFRDNHVVFIYSYNDKNGKLLFEVTISSDLYQ